MANQGGSPLPSGGPGRNLSVAGEGGVNPLKVTLVCIKEELEAWLIADGRALSKILSTDAHAVKVAHTKKADQVSNPKARLKRVFNQSPKRTYVDHVHAIQVVRALPDLNQLNRLNAFSRFSERFLPCNDAYS